MMIKFGMNQHKSQRDEKKFNHHWATTILITHATLSITQSTNALNDTVIGCFLTIIWHHTHYMKREWLPLLCVWVVYVNNFFYFLLILCFWKTKLSHIQIDNNWNYIKKVQICPCMFVLIYFSFIGNMVILLC